MTSKDQTAKQQSIIHEWTKEQVQSAAKPNFGKLYVTAPHLLELLGDVQGMRILELGCGNGFWLRLLARAGAKCTGIDHAENQIEAAKNWDDDTTSAISYCVGDASQHSDLQEQYDVAFFEHVLLEMPEKAILDGAVKSAATALKPGGRLIISDIHPFAPSSRPNGLRVTDDFNYFDSAAPFEIESKRVDGETIYYKDIHWTLSDITNAITGAGLKIIEIREPQPGADALALHPDELGYRMTTPMAIMLVAQKTDG